MRSTSNILSLILHFLLFLGLQVLIFKNLALYNYALCFIYIGFILLLPFDIPSLLLLLLAFFLGIIIDIFYDTLGIHAASCVLIAYMRPHIINLLTPKGGYDKGTEVSIFSLGFKWIFTYAVILIFIHHLTLFLIEIWGVKLIGPLLIKTTASAAFTLIVFTLFQYLFQSSRSYK
jgi:hypothetical protein